MSEEQRKKIENEKDMKQEINAENTLLESIDDTANLESEEEFEQDFNVKYGILKDL